MREQLGDLGLRREVVELDRKFCAGLGSAYLSSTNKLYDPHRQTHLAFAATNFRRAAAHATLLDDRASATELFSMSAAAYSRLRLPYAVMMAALGGGVDLAGNHFIGMLGGPEPEGPERPRSLQKQGVYMLLFQAAMKSTGFDTEHVEASLRDDRRELRACVASPIGVLGLPVGAYLDLAEALSGSGDVSAEEAIFPFLGAYDSAVRQTSRNSYHWSRLLLPFHPAEPDIISVLVVSHLALTRRQRSVFDLLKEFPLSSLSRAILHEALHLMTPKEGPDV